LFDVPEAKVTELRRKHIRIVELTPGADKTEQLSSWLNDLRSIV
jgi:hypothetical protein